MNKTHLSRLAAVCVFFSAAAGADTAAVEQALNRFLPEIKPDEVRPSEAAGLYEVVVGPKVFYVSEDGRYLVQGSLVDLKTKENLTEAKLAKVREKAIEKVGTDRMVIFKPEKVKHTVSVFTDIDCGYCRKLHSEIDQYMNEGIAVQYLFFPRAGVDSASAQKAVSVWCADDRNDALTRAKKGETIESKECENPVREHYSLGIAMGVNGTPAIVSETGVMLPGYVPPKQLAQYLDNTDRKN